MEKTLKIQTEIKPATGIKKSEYKPKIILSGNWLQDCGFNPDEYIRVIFTDNKIVIEPTSSI